MNDINRVCDPMHPDLTAILAARTAHRSNDHDLLEMPPLKHAPRNERLSQLLPAQGNALKFEEGRALTHRSRHSRYPDGTSNPRKENSPSPDPNPPKGNEEFPECPGHGGRHRAFATMDLKAATKTCRERTVGEVRYSRAHVNRMPGYQSRSLNPLRDWTTESAGRTSRHQF